MCMPRFRKDTMSLYRSGKKCVETGESSQSIASYDNGWFEVAVIELRKPIFGKRLR